MIIQHNRKSPSTVLTAHNSTGNHTFMRNIFSESIRDSYLFQHVHEPTRYRNDNIPSVLDLVLSNEDMVEKIKYLPGLESSDHVLLDFDFNCFISVSKCVFKKLNFFKGDCNSINQALLAIPWNETLGSLSLSGSRACLTEKNQQFSKKSGIFLSIYLGPIKGSIPNAKKYIFFPNFDENFPI